MLAQIELTPAHAEALIALEQATGESRAALLARALDSFIEQQRELAELQASVVRGRNEIAAGHCVSHEDAMARIRASLQR